MEHRRPGFHLYQGGPSILFIPHKKPGMESRVLGTQVAAVEGSHRFQASQDYAHGEVLSQNTFLKITFPERATEGSIDPLGCLSDWFQFKLLLL